MRRLVMCLVGAASMLAAPAAQATQYEDYRDTFASGDYSGNDGSLDFSGSWTELADPGGGGHSSGWVRVGSDGCSSDGCLHIDGDGLVLQTFGIRRSADLSLFEVAELCYDLEIDPRGPTTTELHVQVRIGGTWHTIAEHNLATSTDTSVMIPISDYLTAGFQLRFIVPDVLDGGLLGLDLLYTGDATVDNVTVRGIVASGGSTTSTTSTTSPKTTTTSAPPGQPTTTTSPNGSSPTTSAGPPGPSSTVGSGGQGAPLPGETTPLPGETTTTEANTTTTTANSTSTMSGVGGGPSGPSSGSGLREASVGLLADYQPGMIGDLDLHDVEVLGVDLAVDFSMVVELFETAKVWIAILVLVVTAAIVSGMDRRRRSRQPSS